jgi:hypothetical protein
MPSEQMHAFADLAKAELANRKGEYWARKVVYVTGMKAIIPCVNEAVQAQFISLMAQDLMLEMLHRYPGRDSESLTAELQADCDEFADLLINEAETLGELPER